MAVLGAVAFVLINRMHFFVNPQDCLSGIFVSLFVAKDISKCAYWPSLDKIEQMLRMVPSELLVALSLSVLS